MASVNNAQVNAEGTNANKVKCRFCSEIILPAAIATVVDRPLPLPKSDEQDNPEPESFWFVKGQFDFWNIGVARPHNATDDNRYLLCANCDRGPLGMWMKTGDQPGFYVPRDRVESS
jgi:hypothetical protein